VYAQLRNSRHASLLHFLPVTVSVCSCRAVMRKLTHCVCSRPGKEFVKNLFPEMENYHNLFIFNFYYNIEQTTNKWVTWINTIVLIVVMAPVIDLFAFLHLKKNYIWGVLTPQLVLCVWFHNTRTWREMQINFQYPFNKAYQNQLLLKT
jgi:hypothetical protein